MSDEDAVDLFDPRFENVRRFLLKHFQGFIEVREAVTGRQLGAAGVAVSDFGLVSNVSGVGGGGCLMREDLLVAVFPEGGHHLPSPFNDDHGPSGFISRPAGAVRICVM